MSNRWAEWRRARQEEILSQFRQYLRDPEVFRQEQAQKQQVARADSQKETLHAAMTWTELKRRAACSEIVPENVLKVNKPSSPQGDPLLDAALEKATRLLRNATGLDDTTIRKELLARLMKNRPARTSALSAVRLCARAKASWFTECGECGADNDPPWEVCALCQAPRAD